jgi:hypothetical protein
MKIRCSDWPVLVRRRKIFSQRCQRKFITGISRLRLGMKRRYSRFCSIYETSNREENVIGVFRNPSSGRAAKRI